MAHIVPIAKQSVG